MFGYIKQQIAAQQKANEDKHTQLVENKENELIIECAQLFQELDDLSEKGQEINEYRDIDAISVALENDVELESFEVSMADGRILDLPADILVHSESYEPMKGKDEFFEFAYSEMPQGVMDSDEYNNMIQEFVERTYNEYLDTVFQEGVFSAQKLDIKDPSVQWSKTINFGPTNPDDANSAPYTARMPIGYEKLAFNKILLKQKDSIMMIVDNNADTFKDFGNRYLGLLAKHGYTVPEGMSVWDIITPNLIMVPVEPVDSFCVIIRAENKLAKAGDDRFIYISIKMAISSAKKDSSTITDIINLDKKPAFASKIVDSVGLLKESMMPAPVLGRTIQEGIDFGGGDNGGDATNDAPPATVDGSGGDAVSGNDGGGDAVSNDGGDANNGGEATADNPDAVKTDTNDVSKEIAQNVASENEEKDNPDAADDTGSTGDGLDTATTDLPEGDIENPEGEEPTEEPAEGDVNGEPTSDNVDDQLNDLDAAGEGEDLGANIGDLDFDNMTPNQLTQAAAEKIKNMTMSQIQQFLQSDEGSVTEAFILTKKNINAELDAGVRKCLGDLNDSGKSAGEIMKNFKKDGKKLNKALSKAAKMTDVYDESERNSLIKLNKCLADLMVSFREGMNSSEVQVVKRLIKAFASQAQGVGKIIEKHKSDTFQEEAEPELDSLGLPIREI